MTKNTKLVSCDRHHLRVRYRPTVRDGLAMLRAHLVRAERRDWRRKDDHEAHTTGR